MTKEQIDPRYAQMRATLHAIEAAVRDARMDKLTLAEWMAKAARDTLKDIGELP